MSFYGKITSAAAAVLIAGGCAAYASGQSAAVLDSARQTAADLQCYVLTVSGGAVALYKEGEAEPLTVYATKIDEINPADAALLRDGIRLRGMSEVLRLLEDLDVVESSDANAF